MLAGLARDGGLYVPEFWPVFAPERIAALAGLPYAELALEILRPFVDDAIPEGDLARMTREAYGAFRHPAVVPLVQLGPRTFVLEGRAGPAGRQRDGGTPHRPRASCGRDRPPGSRRRRRGAGFRAPARHTAARPGRRSAPGRKPAKNQAHRGRRRGRARPAWPRRKTAADPRRGWKYSAPADPSGRPHPIRKAEPVQETALWRPANAPRFNGKRFLDRDPGRLRPVMPVAPVGAAAPVRTPVAPIAAVIVPARRAIINLGADRPAGLPPAAAPVAAPPNHGAWRLDEDDRRGPRNDGDGRRGGGRRNLRDRRRGLRVEVGGLGVRERPARNDRGCGSDCENHVTHDILPVLPSCGDQPSIRDYDRRHL